MTHKERVIEELTQASGGLTLVQLRERTGFAEASLRTTVWEMRRDRWIEVVGGVRGRFRYGITGEGRLRGPRPAHDAIGELLREALGSLAPTWSSGDRSKTRTAPTRLLLDFVRWLAQERKELLAAGQGDIAEQLEGAAADFMYEAGRADAVEAAISALARGRTGSEPHG